MKGDKLTVMYRDRTVGTLSETADHRVAFAYAADWLQNGFPISPFSLPVREEVFVPSAFHFGGLYGVFADSLPDAWGRLLMDRMLKHRGFDPASVGPLTRLAIIGETGMGALTYHPVWESWQPSVPEDLDALAEECRQLLLHNNPADPDRLFALAGSSGGARPKILTEDWIIKFPASREDPDSGLMEKAYMDCAAICGIHVPETILLPSKHCAGYYAVKRFDRVPQENGAFKHIHMLTAAAILEADWRTPCLDYHTLMKLTRVLCRENPEDAEQMFRRMCFNVFAHNRDDHAKNFAFLYDDEKERWHLSPAYDLTWSSTYFGEHTTTVDGNGRNPGFKELTTVGLAAGIKKGKCELIAEEIRDMAQPLADRWKETGLNYPSKKE